MEENGWQAIGRIAKARRERLGLKQDELAHYGGPRVATVGKFERAAQDTFPTRTQHQIENALGWQRTIIEQVVNSINDGSLSAGDWEHDLIHEDVPDLSRPRVASGDRTLDEALEALRSVLRLFEPEQLDHAVRQALLAIVPLLTDDSATRLANDLETLPRIGGDGDADEPGGSAPMRHLAVAEQDEKDPLDEAEETERDT